MDGWNGKRNEYAELALKDAELGYSLRKHFDGKELVGVASVKVLPDGTAYVGSFATKRRGYGEKFLSELKAEYPVIALTSIQSATGFYRKCGLVPVDETDYYFSTNPQAKIPPMEWIV